MMKCARFLPTLAAAVLLLPAIAAAKDKDEGRFQLTTSVELGSVRLEPGEYKVSWISAGSDVKIIFLQDDKIQANAVGEVIELKHPSPYDDVVLKPTNHGQAKTIDEIDFEGRTEALRIKPTASANNVVTR
jgi:hypothetical protein